MDRWFAIYPLGLLIVAGCGQVSPETAPIIVGQRTVRDWADDPFVELENGATIGVDGVPSGQSVQLSLTQLKQDDGAMVIDVDAAAEPASERKQP
jgi:hypothetical protein